MLVNCSTSTTAGIWGWCVSISFKVIFLNPFSLLNRSPCNGLDVIPSPVNIQQYSTPPRQKTEPWFFAGTFHIGTRVTRGLRLGFEETAASRRGRLRDVPMVRDGHWSIKHGICWGWLLNFPVNSWKSRIVKESIGNVCSLGETSEAHTRLFEVVCCP